MNEAVRDCLVSGYETPHRRTQAPGSSRPARAGSGDQAGAQVIVTSNLKHFPAADLRQWDVEAKSPDDFVPD